MRKASLEVRNNSVTLQNYSGSKTGVFVEPNTVWQIIGTVGALIVSMFGGAMLQTWLLRNKTVQENATALSSLRARVESLEHAQLQLRADVTGIGVTLQGVDKALSVLQATVEGVKASVNRLGDALARDKD